MNLSLLDLDPNKKTQFEMDPVKFAKVADFYSTFTQYASIIEHEAFRNLQVRLSEVEGA